MPEFGEYNPLDHRVVDKPWSDLEAFLYLMKSSFGTGGLAMPYAFYNAGWVIGIMGTFFVSFITIYSLHILISDIFKICRRHHMPQLTYPEAICLAIAEGPPFLSRYSNLFSIVVEALLAFHHFGICWVYVIFIANNLKVLSDIFFEPVDDRIIMSLIIMPLIMSYAIRNADYLKFCMIAADCLMLVSYVIVLYNVTDDLPDVSERDPFKGIATFPFLFGTVLYSIESVGAFVAIQQQMLNPQNFLGSFGILNRGMIIVISFYGLFGFLGYWKYGDQINPSIIENLQSGEFMTYVVVLFFSIAIFLEYALNGYETIGFVWQQHMKQIFPENTDLVSAEYMVRIGVVLCSVLFAILIPLFAHVLSFIGAFCLSILGIILPPVIDICIYYKTGLTQKRVVRNLALIIIGFLIGTLGLISVLVNYFSGDL